MIFVSFLGKIILGIITIMASDIVAMVTCMRYHHPLIPLLDGWSLGVIVAGIHLENSIFSAVKKGW